MSAAEPPLVVDLDDTLIRSDLLVESAFVLARRAPASLLALPAWLYSGRATLKAEIARRADLGIAELPYHAELVEFLRAEKARGRTLILATAANQKYARQVARHLALFDHVLASDACTNLSGQAKLEAVDRHLAGGAFDYAGDHESDRVLWRRARTAILVNADARLVQRVDSEAAIGQTFSRRPAGISTWGATLRLHQWLKNALIFVPLIAAHAFGPPAVGACVLAFFAFCLLASSVYVLNDLVDLPEDRRHPNKRDRPLASGDLAIKHGVLAVPILLLAAVVLAAFLPPPFWAVLAGYYALTWVYSFGLKQVALLDVLCLAGLYTLRIIAGGAAAGIDLSFWLLAFSMSLFLSLAMAKRCTELFMMAQHGDDAPPGRGYAAADLVPLRSLGTAAGYASVVVLALYINSPGIADHYSHPARVWLLCPVVLYWVSRIWLYTLRGHMHDDPIVFAARDTGSRLCLLVAALIVAAAL